MSEELGDIFTAIEITFSCIEDSTLVEVTHTITNVDAFQKGYPPRIMSLRMNGGPFTIAFVHGWVRVMLQIFFQDDQLRIEGVKPIVIPRRDKMPEVEEHGFVPTDGPDSPCLICWKMKEAHGDQGEDAFDESPLS